MTDIKRDYYTLESYGDELADYSGGTYICDAIAEIADAHTSIYYSDIMDFIRENPEDVNEAVQEFGWDGCGGDLMKAAQMGEYLKIERDIYNELDKVLYNYCLDYIEMGLNIKELREDILEEIEFSIDGNAERFDDLTDAIDEILCGAGIIDDDGKITENYRKEVLTK